MIASPKVLSAWLRARSFALKLLKPKLNLEYGPRTSKRHPSRMASPKPLESQGYMNRRAHPVRNGRAGSRTLDGHL